MELQTPTLPLRSRCPMANSRYSKGMPSRTSRMRKGIMKAPGGWGATRQVAQGPGATGPLWGHRCWHRAPAERCHRCKRCRHRRRRPSALFHGRLLVLPHDSGRLICCPPKTAPGLGGEHRDQRRCPRAGRSAGLRVQPRRRGWRGNEMTSRQRPWPSSRAPRGTGAGAARAAGSRAASSLQSRGRRG